MQILLWPCYPHCNFFWKRKWEDQTAVYIHDSNFHKQLKNKYYLERRDQVKRTHNAQLPHQIPAFRKGKKNKESHSTVFTKLMPCFGRNKWETQASRCVLCSVPTHITVQPQTPIFYLGCKHRAEPVSETEQVLTRLNKKKLDINKPLIMESWELDSWRPEGGIWRLLTLLETRVLRKASALVSRLRGADSWHYQTFLSYQLVKCESRLSISEY